MKAEELVDYAKSLDCIHCGLCLRTCPTWQLTGLESSSPRGRVHLMRAVAEGELEPDADFAEEMGFCLVCRNCESVCPSGVQFGAMMEHTRAGLAAESRHALHVRLLRRFGFGRVLRRRAWLRLAAGALRLAQVTGLVRLVAPLLGARGRGLASLPTVPPRRERAPLPGTTPAVAPERGAVALLEGCVMPELLGRVNRAAANVLAAQGFASRTAPGHVCCGSLHAHNGEAELARALARETIAAFDALRDERGAPLPIVVDSAGCGSHMKEYAGLFEDEPGWRARAEAFSARVRDFAEFLAPVRRELAAPGRPEAVRSPVAFDDPCHLCHGQGIRSQPRELIDALAGVQRVELDESESCCGSAGIYSLLRPADSAAILAPRLDALEASGARTLVTANPGCQLQWQSGVAARGLEVEVLHLAELLERAQDLA